MHLEEPGSLAEVWEDGSKVEAFLEEGGAGTNVTIAANREGLLSLAKLLLLLAKEDHEEGYHVHLDEHSGLERSSNAGLILQKASLLEPPNR